MITFIITKTILITGIIASIIDIKDYENLSFIRQEKAKRLYDGVLKTYQIDLDTYSKNILYLFDQGPLNTKEIDLGVHKNASWKKQSFFICIRISDVSK